MHEEVEYTTLRDCSRVGEGLPVAANSTLNEEHVYVMGVGVVAITDFTISLSGRAFQAASLRPADDELQRSDFNLVFLCSEGQVRFARVHV